MNENQKVQVSQDTLYAYLTEHGVKLARLAELMEISSTTISDCFNHTINKDGLRRSFTKKAVVELNIALGRMAERLRELMLTFGSDQTFTNQRGATYDPALVGPMKKIGELLNLTALVQRVLGWSLRKKENILVAQASKVYGHISKQDVDRINAELLSVAGVLSTYEVVADATARGGSAPA